ncbi:hypothetical protein PRUPE_4G220700 [Prunus persica]|uniref:Uncharacterized protein n=1 Tax=Prunus persica TaxID=3760 RepID=A0A251PQS0_PRUPE|nr:hypothetical protein PRUPE_4G220700 [Prunus persica]
MDASLYGCFSPSNIKVPTQYMCTYMDKQNKSKITSKTLGQEEKISHFLHVFMCAACLRSLALPCPCVSTMSIKNFVTRVISRRKHI